MSTGPSTGTSGYTENKHDDTPDLEINLSVESARHPTCLRSRHAIDSFSTRHEPIYNEIHHHGFVWKRCFLSEHYLPVINSPSGHVECSVTINESNPSVAVPTIYPVISCAALTSVTTTITQTRPLHTACGAAQALQIYAACANMSCYTTSHSRIKLTMYTCHSCMTDCTGLETCTASRAPHTHSATDHVLLTLHERQSLVINRSNTDFIQKSVVVGMRVASHVTS